MNAHSSPNSLLSQPTTHPILETEKEDEPPGGCTLTEVKRHHLTLSSEEKKIGKLTAIGSGLGNAAIISSGWLFAVTPWQQVGLGVAVGTTASIIALAVVSATTVLLTIPLSYIAYEEYMIETKSLEQEIAKEEALRKRNRENLFFELLRLRCLLGENENEFYRIFELLKSHHDAKEAELMSLINQIYNREEFKSRSYYFDESNTLQDSKSRDIHPHYTLMNLFCDAAFAQDEGTRKKALNAFNLCDKEFKNKLSRCFNPIARLPTFYFKPIAYGTTGAIMFTATLFGTYWTFATMVVCAGISASIPILGWGILALACVAASIALGVWVGKSKNKNMQREELKLQLEKRNQSLDHATGEIKKACLKPHLARYRFFRQEAAHSESEKVVINHQPLSSLPIKLNPS